MLIADWPKNTHGIRSKRNTYSEACCTVLASLPRQLELSPTVPSQSFQQCWFTLLWKQRVLQSAGVSLDVFHLDLNAEYMGKLFHNLRSNYSHCPAAAAAAAVSLEEAKRRRKIAQSCHGTALNAARYDLLERLKIWAYIQREAVRCNPTSCVETDGCHLRASNPDPGMIRLTLPLKVVPRQDSNDDLIDSYGVR